jgi:hypothetical protein
MPCGGDVRHGGLQCMKEHMKETTVPMKENRDRKEEHSYYMSLKTACKVV